MATHDTDSQMHAAAYIAAGAPKLPRARGAPTSYVTSSPSIRASFDVTREGRKKMNLGLAQKQSHRLTRPHSELISNAGRGGGKVADGK